MFTQQFSRKSVLWFKAIMDSMHNCMVVFERVGQLWSLGKVELKLIGILNLECSGSVAFRYLLSGNALQYIKVQITEF
jgi:hypothetical protein